jgi:hypothetical protein
MIRARFVPFVDDERPDRDARAPARATPHKPCRRKSTSGERAGACDFRRAWTDSRPPRFARRLFSLSSAARCRGTGAAGGRGCSLNPVAGNRRAERAPGLARSVASRPNRAARDSRAVCSRFPPPCTVAGPGPPAGRGGLLTGISRIAPPTFFDSPLPRKSDSIRASPIRARFVSARIRAPNPPVRRRSQKCRPPEVLGVKPRAKFALR